MAVALNPALDYAVVQCDVGKGNERLVIAEALLKDTMLRYGAEHYQVIAYCKGSDLEGLSLAHPFYAREVPVILGDHVTTEAGTGAVHTAPGHGQDDYVVGSRYGLEVYNPVGSNGCFLPDTELFAGEHVFAANAHVIEVLKGKGALRARGNTAPQLSALLAPQDADHLPCHAAVVHQHGAGRPAQARRSRPSTRCAGCRTGARRASRAWSRGRPDWCVSRQRTWGVPITLFVHKQTR